MKKFIHIFLILGCVFFENPLFSEEVNSKQSCIENLIQKEGVCAYVSAGELMGTANKQAFNSLMSGSKNCYFRSLTLETNSLVVFLCNGSSYSVTDSACYKTINLGQTLVVTGILSSKKAPHELVEPTCYIRNESVE